MLKTTEVPDSSFAPRDYLFGMLAVLGLVLSQWAL